MTFLRLIFFAVSWLLLPPAGLRAQQTAGPEGGSLALHPGYGPVQFDHFSGSDGLTIGHVLSVLQDRQGFMWFGTVDGLFRYDGYQIHVFQHLPLDSTSLPGDVVYALFEDGSGVLWVGTSGGLSRMDRTAGTFTSFLPNRDFAGEPWRNDVGTIYEDYTGAFWLGTFGGGLYRMDRATGALTHYQHDPEEEATLSFNVIEAIHEDRAGTLWVSTINGLNRFDRAAGTFTRYLYPPDEAYNGSIVDFIEDSEEQGTFWLTAATGLVRFVPSTGEIRRYISYPISSSLQSGPWWSMPQGIARDPLSPEVLWVAVPRVGLYRFDTATEATVLYRHDPEDLHSLGGEPHAVYRDRTGLIWVGTHQGVSRFDPAASTFRHYLPGQEAGEGLLHRNVTALHEGRSGVLWVGTGDFLVGTALSRIDWLTGTFTHWPSGQDAPSAAGLGHNIGITALYEDQAGGLWIGTDPGDEESAGGLSRMDPATGTFTHYRHRPGDPGSLGRGSVVQIYEDAMGFLWIGTSQGGVSRMDRATETFTRYEHDPQDPASLSGNEVRVILGDREGQLWVGTNDGLSRFDRATETFVNYRHIPGDPNGLSSSSVFSLHERRAEPGVLWIGTAAALDRFDTRAGTFDAFDAKDGLPDYPVVGLLEDDEGHLWMSTSGAGLLRLDPETGALQHYDEKSRVQSRRFNLGAAFRSPRTGEMFFGGINGFNAFHPSRMGGNTTPPPVVLTDFKLFGVSVPVGADTPLRQPLWETQEIRLTHGQDAFSFDFVALHYKNPAKNRYAYRLDGFDADWVMAGNVRTATYTNLDPGTYTFRVRAANSDGVWNEEGVAVRLVMLPPWWRTAWAYLLYALLLGAAVVAAGRMQRAHLIRKEREAAHIRENKLRTEAAEAWANYLQAENERQTQELEQARTLQLSMLPKQVPEHPMVEIAAYMKTAAEIGGDYYDFDVAADGTLTLAIGDATGHGTPAGTMVTAVKSLFTAYARDPDIVQVLRRSTQALKRMNLPRLYMALALGKLRGRMLELAGAGMPPALVYRAASGCVEQVPLKGLPLGSVADFAYQKTCVALAPGDTVVLMSDGFPELFNDAGHMLGYDRAVSVFKEAAGGSVEEVMAHLTQTAARWADGRPQGDDVTFIVMKVKEDV